jgi:ABC-2 type transport system permease protein
MLAAFRGEMFKVERRPAVWVCIVALVALAVTFSYVLLGLLYSHPPKGSSQGLPPGTTLSIFLVTLYPINFVKETLSTWANLGGVFALIIGVLVQGSEFGWGTVKTLYTQRSGRLMMLAGKLVSLAVMVLLMVVGLFAATAVASLVVAVLEGADTTFPPADVIVKGLGACFLVYGFWALLGVALATLFRQSAMAIGLGLAYALVFENLVFGLLSLIGGNTINQIHQWFPIANTGYLIDSFGAVRIRGLNTAVTPFADATHAVTILLVYVVGFIVVSSLVVRARDVTS